MQCRSNSNELKETGIAFMEQDSHQHFSATDVKQSAQLESVLNWTGCGLDAC